MADFFGNCKQTAENCKQIAENWKKSATPKTHFGFTNDGSNIFLLRLTAIWNKKKNFDLGHPVGNPYSGKLKIQQESFWL